MKPQKLLLIIFSFGLTVSSFAQTWNTFNTNYGYIQLGPANSQWAHIYTDMDKFIFNKTIYTFDGFSAYSSNDLKLQTAGVTRLSIKRSSGNVGIGTTNPSEKLEVNGNILVPSGHRLKIGTDNPNSGHIQILSSTTQYYNNYWDIKGNLYFRRNNNGSNQGAIMALQQDGTVTINVWEKYDNSIANTSGHKLMVNGGILAERIEIIGDVPNSDYVFEADYDLPTIEDVKDYVHKNKHLPGIPSANEFNMNGYCIGEMDDMLLRKVEELTLYVIELNEKVNSLQRENDSLKSASSK
jgi:hypothetical protein